MNQIKLRKMLQQFLIDDIGDMDVTSQSIFPPSEIGEGIFIVKEDGIIAGTEIIKEVYQLLDPSIKIETFVNDGQKAEKGTKIAKVSGSIAQLLTGERLILNLMQRMSGIATITNA